MAACIASTSSSSSHMALNVARQMVRRRPAVALIATQSRSLHTTPNRDFDFNFKGITQRIRALRSTEEQEKLDQQKKQEQQQQGLPDADSGNKEQAAAPAEKKKSDRSEPSLADRLSSRAKNVMLWRRQQEAQREGSSREKPDAAPRRIVGGRAGLYGTRAGSNTGSGEWDYLGANISAEGDELFTETQQETLDARTEHLIARLEQRNAHRQQRKRWGGDLEHKYSTAVFRISTQKLQQLADQINGKPIDHAILQMQFSPKRASQRILSTLCLARDHAVAKGLDRSRMVVSEAWVNKGPSAGTTYIHIMGRGRFGMAHHPKARMHIVLRHGKSRHDEEEKRLEKARRMVRSVGTGGVARTARPLTTSRPAWGY